MPQPPVRNIAQVPPRNSCCGVRPASSCAFGDTPYLFVRSAANWSALTAAGLSTSTVLPSEPRTAPLLKKIQFSEFQVS